MTLSGMILSIIAILILLILSGIFSGSETALTAASRARMFQLEKAGNTSAALVNRLIIMRARLIGVFLLGNNLVNILASALATHILLEIFGSSGIIYATLIMTALVLIFSEILPKTWALTNPDKFALSIARVARLMLLFLGPIVSWVEILVQLILRAFHVHADAQTATPSAHEELRGAVDLQHYEGGLIKDEKDRLGGLLNLTDLEVSDIMIHRTKIQALNVDDPPALLLKTILESPYTRFPLCSGTPDNIVGVLHVKDLLGVLGKTSEDINTLDIRALALDPWFVPETTSVEDQLNAFLRRKNHFALVVDEYGEVMGLVTLEDILEEIVGDIADEHDIFVTGVQQQSDGSVIADGAVPIRDINRVMEWNLPDEEATTIAGLVIHEARMIPEERQIFTFHGFRFTILRREKNRLIRLRLAPLNAPTGLSQV